MTEQLPYASGAILIATKLGYNRICPSRTWETLTYWSSSPTCFKPAWSIHTAITWTALYLIVSKCATHSQFPPLWVPDNHHHSSPSSHSLSLVFPSLRNCGYLTALSCAMPEISIASWAGCDRWNEVDWARLTPPFSKVPQLLLLTARTACR